LGAGMTSADFQMRGTYPSRKEALNIADTGSLIRGANSLNSQFRTSSGPEDLCILTRDCWYSTWDNGAHVVYNEAFNQEMSVSGMQHRQGQS